MKNHGRCRDEFFVAPKALDHLGHVCEAMLWEPINYRVLLRRANCFNEDIPLSDYLGFGRRRRKPGTCYVRHGFAILLQVGDFHYLHVVQKW